MANIEIYTGPACGYCEAAKTLLNEKGMLFTELDITDVGVLATFRERLPRVKSVPQVFINGKHIGGYEDLVRVVNNGSFAER
ncbi:glutaredoxin domain-containing protein [Pelagibius sp. Alg239-R121]|uniref:glutaredoxin domain-containing protein n=1 Tax=Pelagibius sp. Alg239-R121 TaxID=2993448 RepID=UPI0024A742AB|nr:glutaredoxin domain-containing protein [Pelagibius sp. Alg239-R121]